MVLLTKLYYKDPCLHISVYVYIYNYWLMLFTVWMDQLYYYLVIIRSIKFNSSDVFWQVFKVCSLKV